MMTDIFWLIMLFPIVWPLIAKRLFHTTISFKEMLLNIGLVVLLSSFVWFISLNLSMRDTELWSGQVTRVEDKQQTCPSGWRSTRDSHCTEYQTREVYAGQSCTTNSNGNQTCTPIYETEYRYIFPWETRYYIHTSLNKTFEISRIDRQGVNPPPRWKSTNVGDPAAITNSYVNYVKAASTSLFHEDAEYHMMWETEFPQYPTIYDLYKVDRVIAVNVDIDTKEWSNQLAMLQRHLGPIKQANVNLIFTDNPNPAWLNGLRSFWEGYKKNDVVIGVGVNDDGTFSWVNVHSWSKLEMVNIAIRDDLSDLNSLDISEFMRIIDNNVRTHYERMEMADFEYLKSEIPIPLAAKIVVLLLAFIGSPLLTFVFHRTEF